MEDPRGRVPKPDTAIVADFRGRMRSDPAGLLDSLRDAYTSRVPSVYNKDLYSLLDCFVEAYLDSEEDGTDTRQDPWKTLVTAGLPELYQEMASAPEFFSEYPAFIEGVLLGLMQMAMLSDTRVYRTSRRALLQNAPSMFQSFWRHRDLIPHAGTVMPGYRLVVYECIAQVTQKFMILYKSVGVHPVTPKTFIPHVGLCCWFNLDTSLFTENALSAMHFLRDSRTTFAAHPTTKFIQEAGVDAYGAELLVERFIKDTKSSSISWRHLHVSLGMLARFTLHPALLPLIGPHNILDIFAEALKRSQREAPSEEAWDVWVECALFLRYQIEVLSERLRYEPLKDRSALLGEEMIDMTACGIQQLVGKQNNDPTDLVPCKKPVQLLVKLAQQCKSKSGQHTNDLRRSLEKGARALWYPALRLLRTEQPRFVELGQPISDVIQPWMELGAELGLDELRERNRHEREGLQHCAWKICRYHIERPETALFACRGCGEVRYCGRACQAKDWKEGGHKVKCRRLKN